MILLHRLRKFYLYAPFSHHPAGTRFCPFLSPLMAFEGVSCYHRTLRPLKHAITRRKFSIYSLLICHFPRSFLKNVGDFPKNVGDFSKNVGDFPKNVGHFPKNVGVFFQSPPREDFSQQIETQIKQEMEELQV